MGAPTYLSFLIRLWPESTGPPEPVRWQGELEGIQTGDRSRFDSLEELYQQLQRRLAMVERQ